MIQKKIALAALLSGSLLIACSKGGSNDDPGSDPPPPPPVDTCLLLKKFIDVGNNARDITYEYDYQPGSTDGKYSAVIRTSEIEVGLYKPITSKSYEHTGTGFTCKRYDGGIGSGTPTSIEEVELNNKNMPVKAKIKFDLGDEQEWSYIYNEKDELQKITINSKNSGNVLVKVDWADGNPVKVAMGIPVGDNLPGAILEVVNEYSDKPFKYDSWKTMDPDMSQLYDKYHLHLALKRKNHLKKQVETMNQVVAIIVSTHTYSDHVINKDGKLTGFKIEMKGEASANGGPLTPIFEEKGTATANTKCD